MEKLSDCAYSLFGVSCWVSTGSRWDLCSPDKEGLLTPEEEYLLIQEEEYLLSPEEDHLCSGSTDSAK